MPIKVKVFESGKISRYFSVDSFTFPGGECHVRLGDKLEVPLLLSDKVEITAYLYNSKDIMILLFCVDAIRRINSEIRIKLIIPYLPYARQDRVCTPGESLAVKVMADLINSLKCNEVHIYDPHSDVAGALINNCITIPLHQFLYVFNKTNFDLLKDCTLVSPDSGAEKKVLAAARSLGIDKIVYASKIRNFRTGQISGTTISHGDLYTGGNYIILDDICDGGRTFIELSKQLIARGINKDNIYLYITHGIFSQGLDVLTDYFKHIYCYHTFLTVDKIDKEFLTVLEYNNAYQPTDSD